LFDVTQKRTTEAVHKKYEILIVALTKVTVVWDLRHSNHQLPSGEELLPLSSPVIRAHCSEFGGSKLLRNISTWTSVYTAPYPRRLRVFIKSLCCHQICEQNCMTLISRDANGAITSTMQGHHVIISLMVQNVFRGQAGMLLRPQRF
jgi:hypothetical protein